MRHLLILILLLPIVVAAQLHDSVRQQKEGFRLPEGYVEAGLVNELWIINSKLPAGYTSLTYRGPGAYIGGGMKQHHVNGSNWEYSIAVHYLQYNLTRYITDIEQARTGYQFFHISPTAQFQLKQISNLTFSAGGSLHIFTPLHVSERGYFGAGITGTVNYKMFDLNVSYNYSPGKKAPSRDINSAGWHEQMFLLGVACYPYRIAKFRAHFTGNLWKQRR